MRNWFLGRRIRRACRKVLKYHRRSGRYYYIDDTIVIRRHYDGVTSLDIPAEEVEIYLLKFPPEEEANTEYRKFSIGEGRRCLPVFHTKEKIFLRGKWTNYLLKTVYPEAMQHKRVAAEELRKYNRRPVGN